jgi:hypothetical protein
MKRTSHTSYYFFDHPSDIIPVIRKLDSYKNVTRRLGGWAYYIKDIAINAPLLQEIFKVES